MKGEGTIEKFFYFSMYIIQKFFNKIKIFVYVWQRRRESNPDLRFSYYSMSPWPINKSLQSGLCLHLALLMSLGVCRLVSTHLLQIIVNLARSCLFVKEFLRFDTIHASSFQTWCPISLETPVLTVILHRNMQRMLLSTHFFQNIGQFVCRLGLTIGSISIIFCHLLRVCLGILKSTIGFL